LNDAHQCEQSGSILTCQAIVRATLGIGVEEQDRKNTWLNDAENFEQKGAIETARDIYSHMTSVFPGKKSVWLKAARLERQHGNRETLDAILKKATSYCPQAEILWLMAAKEKWLAGDVPAARGILNAAFAANPDSEEIWLAAVKLESENNEYERARLLLTKARERAGTARVWMKSAKLERQLGNRKREEEMLVEALKKYTTYPKLYMMLGQLQFATQRVKEARETYKTAVKSCPNSVELWISYADFEIAAEQAYAKARSIHETARLKNPKNAKLWLAAIRVEQRAKNDKVAGQLLATALQECPTSGILWAHAIATDPRPARKSRSYDALKRCSDDSHVFVAVAKLFWVDRKIKKARNWFNRAVTAEPDNGDAWAFWYKFELENGTEDKQKHVLKKCTEADPHHGELWTRVSKAVENHSMKPEAIVKMIAQETTDLFDIAVC